jgi:hypothetical protein
MTYILLRLVQICEDARNVTAIKRGREKCILDELFR